ncbi:hypothetical protein ANN_24631 [Periplaneta americana]|uniref:Uncharacterized protein n=1 Tax=Periplaneta americana TaxID=6978 RepID=A0ABQ8S3W1_PERAM|nr:hypothetical protein ANN_24631 [Periplaneta americana]
MSPGSSTESYPAFAHIGLRENPGKNLNQTTCPDRESNPGHLVSQPDALTTRNHNARRYDPIPDHPPPSAALCSAFELDFFQHIGAVTDILKTADTDTQRDRTFNTTYVAGHMKKKKSKLSRNFDISNTNEL